MSFNQKKQRLEHRVWVRSQPVKSMFRPPEHDDLETIAEAWGVPVATAVWAIVVDQLARWRREAPEYGKYGLAIVTATTVLCLRGQGAWSGAADGQHPKEQ